MTTVYIAGPMTGKPDLNRPAFNKKAEELRAEGFRVLNPAQIGDLPYEEYWPINKAMLDGADIIYMLDGWEDSEGARRELYYALNLYLPILFESVLTVTRLLDHRQHSIKMSKLSNCNDCDKQKTCVYIPKWGEQVRINCAFWVEKQEKTCKTCKHFGIRKIVYGVSNKTCERSICENCNSGKRHIQLDDSCSLWCKG